jgi:hypothetical protein
MRTICHAIAHVAPIVGIGLMLAGVFGGPALPAASAADVDLFTYQHHWGYQTPDRDQTPWGPQDYWGQRDPWRPQAPWEYRLIGRPEGIACRIATRCTRERSASCSASASGAAASIHAANTGANVKEGEPGCCRASVSPWWR